MKLRTIVLLIVCAVSFSARGADKPNVLFIAVDDLNHWIGHLGRHPQAKTPNIDRLAKMGVTFANAQCAAPVCNPSRAALMSGLRPGTTGVYDNGQNWQRVIPKEQTLTTQFLKAGYEVFGAGKIYHASAHREGEWTGYFSGTRAGPLVRDSSATNNGVGGIQFAPLASGDEVMPDYRVVSHGLEQLEKKHDKPFFLAIGLAKPHMPWNVPKKYFDQFPLERIELPPYREDDLNDIPPSGVNMARQGDHKLILQSGRWKEAVQAYLASISFCDAMVGRLLDGFEKSAYRTNTIVVFFGDHGWSLGEKHSWRKFALWEESARAPFIWVAPGVTKPGGICARPVDFMSIYPTLCELAGVERPKHVEGVSIKPLLANPAAEWHTPGITTFHRNNHSIRSEQWRYIRYADGGEELYDHRSDPYEWTNVVSRAEHAAVKADLMKWLPTVNKTELPRGAATE